MTSGIPDSAEDEFDVEGSAPWTMFDYLAETPLAAAPGEVFSYSNLSASAAGYLRVLAVDPAADDLYGGYETLLQQRVLQPPPNCAGCGELRPGTIRRTDFLPSG